MARLIKRYGSRKLYDTEDSRYIALEDIANWVREGQEIQVIDNKTSEDVTGQTLTQVISEEGRKGSGFLSNEVLHELIRLGEAASRPVRAFQHGVDSLVRRSLDRLVPGAGVREEMDILRQRLQELEKTLEQREGKASKEADESDKGS